MITFPGVRGLQWTRSQQVPASSFHLTKASSSMAGLFKPPRNRFLSKSSCNRKSISCTIDHRMIPQLGSSLKTNKNSVNYHTILKDEEFFNIFCWEGLQRNLVVHCLLFSCLPRKCISGLKRKEP